MELNLNKIEVFSFAFKKVVDQHEFWRTHNLIGWDVILEVWIEKASLNYILNYLKSCFFGLNLLVVIGIGGKWLCSMLGKFNICCIFGVLSDFHFYHKFSFKQKIWKKESSCWKYFYGSESLVWNKIRNNATFFFMVTFSSKFLLILILIKGCFN